MVLLALRSPRSRFRDNFWLADDTSGIELARGNTAKPNGCPTSTGCHLPLEMLKPPQQVCYL